MPTWLRHLWVPVAGIAGLSAAAIPTLALGGVTAGAATPPATASFVAVDYAWEVSGTTDTKATIAQGGTVSFGYPSGASHHNADFASGPHPPSCRQTAGPSSGPVPPLPASPTGPGWRGSCTFDSPGTYTFHCDLHPFMTATIVVQAVTSSSSSSTSSSGSSSTTSSGTTSSGTTSQSTSTASSSTTTSTGTGPTPAPPPPRPPRNHRSPLAGTAARAISISSRQRGTRVRGSARISAAGAGGRMEVELFTARSELHPTGAASAAIPQPVRVGDLLRRELRAGTLRFSLQLGRGARRALRTRGRLGLTVRLTLISPAGERVRASRRVAIRK